MIEPRIRGRDFAVGLAAATVIWTLAFRGRSHFWEKMTAGVGALGAFALYANPSLRKVRPRPRDIATGLASAGALYGVFQVGDRFARRVMPNGAADIDDVYRRRQLSSTTFIAPALGLVIAPGEELFWRGLVNGYLAQELGPTLGNATGAVIYGGIHLVSGNLTLTGAAGIAGAFWSLQYLFEGSLAALIVSHVTWDIWIFLVQPTVAP
ncbi:MAG: CPBP family intramembrane glutamic endopeptidase [Candidatus Dormiibacterota bacterium]